MACDSHTLAWLAGLFEGEGSIYIAKNGGVRLTIRMTDLDIIERVNECFPCTKIQVVHPAGGVKTQYAWRLSNPEKVEDFLVATMGWYGERRKAAAERVLRHLETRPGTGGFHRNK